MINAFKYEVSNNGLNFSMQSAYGRVSSACHDGTLH